MRTSVGRAELLQLNFAEIERGELAAQRGDIHRLRRFRLDEDTALEIDAEIEPLDVSERDGDDDKKDRNAERPPALGDEIDLGVGGMKWIGRMFRIDYVRAILNGISAAKKQAAKTEKLCYGLPMLTNRKSFRISQIARKGPVEPLRDAAALRRGF